MSVDAAAPRVPGWTALLVLSVLCHGLAAGVWKHAHVDVGAFCLCFVLGKAAVSAGFLATPGRWPVVDRASRPFLAASLVAAALNGLAWVAYFVAFERGPLAVVQTLTAAYTAVSAVLAVVFLRERLSRAQTVGVVLVVAAGMLLTCAGHEPATGGRGPWLAATFAAVALWGSSTVVAKYAYGLARADDRRFFLAHGLGMLATVLPFGLWSAPSHGGHGAATLAVVLLYVVGDLALFAAIARGPASIVNPLSGLYPIPTIAYAALVLGEAPDRVGWAAIALVLPGLVLVVPGAAGSLTRRCGPTPRRGVELLRRLDEGERGLLQAAFEGCRAGMPEGVRLIHWVNLFLNGEFMVDNPRQRELHDWVTRTVGDAYREWEEVHILAYGFIVNPAGNPDGQPFHCDYNATSSNLFVTMTPVSPRNAMQFIRQPFARARLDHKAEFGSLEDILDAEGCDVVEVAQLICRPFSLLRLLPDTPHRGIANGEDYDRVMFIVTVDTHPHVIRETAYFQYSSSEYRAAPDARPARRVG